jgi:hypothetical protein
MKYSRYVIVALVLALPVVAAQAELNDALKKLGLASKTPDKATVAAGLREALEQGTGRAVASLGRTDGFWKNARLRIPMPPKLAKAEKTLRKLGQDKLVDDFVLSLNRAAEDATPVARDIFVGAIRKMTIKDAMTILKGPDDAATQYFRVHAEAPLGEAFRPIVQRSTDSVGVTARYKKLTKKVGPLGLVNERDLDLDGYVTQKAMDGLFAMIADEEARIRKDPVARTSELLRKVFR